MVRGISGNENILQFSCDKSWEVQNKMNKKKIFFDIQQIVLGVHSNDPEMSPIIAQHKLAEYINSIPTQTKLEVMCDLPKYLERQKEWSIKTFGNGKRTLGIIKHIQEELKEIEDQPNDLTEWIDVVILAIDGYWRHGGEPDKLMEILQSKQDKNFARVYPFPKSEDEPSEHDRSI